MRKPAHWGTLTLQQSKSSVDTDHWWTPQTKRFRKGVGGRVLATKEPPKIGKKVPQKFVPLLLRGHRQKGAEKRPQSLA